MRKKIIIYLVIFCMVLAFSVVFEFRAVGVSANSAVLIEMQTGKVLYEKNAHQKLSMASTTKIMTALLTLESQNLDTYFTVNPKVIQVEGTSMGLLEGDQVTLRALAYGMLLASGNDAANSAAVAVGGSIDAFVAMMNERAKLLGMKNTSFKTPSGLDDDGHYSTAYDMALLASAALSNPDFVEICSKETAKIKYGNPPYDRWLKNHNKLLTGYDGTIGVKTGFTKKSGRCLVSAATKNGITLICVTLNDKDDWQDHKNLFEYGFSNVTLTEIGTNLPTSKIDVVGGTFDKANILCPDVTQIPLLADEQKNLTKEVNLPQFIYAPVKEGEVIGSITYKLDGKVVETLSIITAEDIEYKKRELGFWDKLFIKLKIQKPRDYEIETKTKEEE